MRLHSQATGFAAATTAMLMSGAAFAQQALEIVGQPIDKLMGFQPPVTEMARDLQWLDHALLILITVISVFVTALLVVVAVRYNARRNPKPATFTHNSPLEVAWTLIPTVILVVLGAFSLPILWKSQEIPVADITIKATGYQWYWGYEYVGEDVAFDSYMIGSPATGGDNMMTPEVEKQLVESGYAKEQFLLATDTAIVIPVGKTIVFQVTGADVIHAWKIPAFGVMQDGVPGRLAHLWFKAEREGICFGQCSELCGLNHAYMPITVKVVSEETYAKWLVAAKAGDVLLAHNAATKQIAVAANN